MGGRIGPPKDPGGLIIELGGPEVERGPLGGRAGPPGVTRGPIDTEDGGRMALVGGP